MNAIPLIFLNSQQNYEVNDEALNFLRQINQDIFLSVSIIVGKYRTGKSFFINKVFLNDNKFKIGSTINACTKGLWIYPQTIQVSENHHMLIIDTEGLGSTDLNKNQDSMIILLSMLISSLFIYNTVGTIDENSFSDLSTIINIAKKIDQNFKFPQLLWTIRDFSLQLVNQQGDQITQKQYLESFLEEQKGVSETVLRKNQMRQQFKQVFQQRDCSVFIRPVEDEQKLQNLDQNTELRQKFLDQIEQTKNKIFKKIQIKEINNQKLNGDMLINAIINFCDVINQGQIPTIKNTYNYMIQNHYKNQIQKLQIDIQNDIQNLEQINNNSQQSLENQYISKIKMLDDKDDISQYSNKIKKLIKKQLKIRSQQLLDILQKQQQEQIKSKFNPMIKNMIENLQQDVYSDVFIFQNCMSDLIYNMQESGFKVLQKELFQIMEIALNHFNKKNEKKQSYQNDQLNLSQQENQKQLQIWNQEKDLISFEYEQQIKLKQQSLENVKQELQMAQEENIYLQQKNDQLIKQKENNQQETIIQDYKAKFQNSQQQTNNLKEQWKDKYEFQQIQLGEKKRIISNLKEEILINNIKFQNQLNAIKQQSQNITNENENIKTQNKQLKIQLQNQEQQIKDQEQIIKKNNQKKVGSERQIILQEKNTNIQDQDSQICLLQQSLDNTQFLFNQSETINIKLKQQIKNLNKNLQQKDSIILEKQNQNKQLKKILEQNANFTCNKCYKNFQFENFQIHINQCDESPQLNYEFKVTVNQLNFKIEINYQDQQWQINRCYSEICKLNHQLVNQFQNIEFPNELKDLQEANIQNQIIKESLEQYLNQIQSNKFIIISDIFKNFIKAEKKNEQQQQQIIKPYRSQSFVQKNIQDVQNLIQKPKFLLKKDKENINYNNKSQNSQPNKIYFKRSFHQNQ